MPQRDTVTARVLLAGIAAGLLCLAGPARSSDTANPGQPAAAPLPLPATFAGELPCGDCTGRRIVLTLAGDRTYRLRRTYLGATDSADKDFFELGRWGWDTTVKPVRLQLDGGGAEQVYRLLSADRLQADSGGNGATPASAYTLTRQSNIDPIAGPMRLRGLYSYMADAAVFSECRTGRRYPVSAQAAQGDMERAYLELTRGNPGTQLLATVEGRFDMQATDPAAAPREHLVIERFERFWPGETCAREALAAAGLFNTYWRPVEIDGEPVAAAPQQREPHFILSTDRRVRGFTGCNRMTGGFEQDVEGLRFSALATTRMACQPAAARIEARFLDALNATAAQRIVGDSLELSDANGQLRMRLEAVYLH